MEYSLRSLNNILTSFTEELLERPEAGGGNFSRRAMRHVLNKSHTREEHLDSSLEVLALKNQLVWEGSNGTTPRVRDTLLHGHYRAKGNFEG